MKIITNEKLIKRNKTIGQVTTIASLLILGAGLYVSFTDTSGSLISITFGALIFGFLLSQVGIYFGNRWGKSPRPDEKLTAALKGLDDRYTLYHYYGPVSHLLLGPSGVTPLLPYSQSGKILFDAKRGRWTQKGGNLYLKLFGQEGLGRPDMEVRYNTDDLTKFLTKNSIEPLPPIQPVLVFLNPKAELEVADAAAPTLDVDKLKDWVRKHSKEGAIPSAQQKRIEALFPQE